MNLSSINIEYSDQKSIKNFLPQNHFPNVDTFDDWWLPVQTFDRKNIHSIQLTTIGAFGLERQARPGIPAHLHTGNDIKPPSENFAYEPVFPAAVGMVISVRDDGPFAQIIIEHHVAGGEKIWTVYEHVSAISVLPGDKVEPFESIASFMNQEELNRFGWQFNHLHFEVLKAEPKPVLPTLALPNRFFETYWMVCRSIDILMEKYYDPWDIYRKDVGD